MEDIVFKVLTNNEIYFCEELTNPATSSVQAMLKCFEIFIVEEGWLFYRLKENCVEKGYLDENECLIGPCDDYSQMICMAKIFDGGEVVKNVESSSWIEEEDFYLSRNNGTLRQLIDEISKTDGKDDGDPGILDDNHMSEKWNMEQDDEYSDIIKNSGSENDNTQNDIKNFEHGYSSEGSSENNNSHNDLKNFDHGYSSEGSFGDGGH